MEKPKPTKKIWLFRHGESAADAGGKTSDSASIPLTSAGRSQAETIAQGINEAPELIITSPYVRALETAMPLQKRYPNVVCEHWPVHEFTYISTARCENTTVNDRKPMVEAYWKKADPDYRDGEGAESFDSFIERALECLYTLQGRKEKFIVIFTHAQFMGGIKWLYDNNKKKPDMRTFREFIIKLAIKNGQKIEFLL